MHNECASKKKKFFCVEPLVFCDTTAANEAVNCTSLTPFLIPVNVELVTTQFNLYSSADCSFSTGICGKTRMLCYRLLMSYIQALMENREMRSLYDS